MSHLYLLGSVLVVLAAIPANIIVAVYLRLPWRSTPIGKSFMQKAIAIALVLDLVIVGLFIGRYNPVFEALRVGVFGYFVWAMWRQMFVLFNTIREGQEPPATIPTHEHGDA